MDNIKAYTGLPKPLDRDYARIGNADIANILMAILASSGGRSAGFGPSDSTNLLNTSNQTFAALERLGLIQSFTQQALGKQDAIVGQTSVAFADTFITTMAPSPNGTCSNVILGKNVILGYKGRLSRINFFIIALSGGTLPTLSIQGSPDNNNYTTIGIIDSQTLQIVPASTPLDPTSVGKSFVVDNNFIAYRIKVNNTSGNTGCTVIATIS